MFLTLCASQFFEHIGRAKLEKFLKKHHAQFVQVKVIQPTLQLVLCCQKCNDKFDGNPAAHVPSVVPRPAPDFVVENLKGKDITLKLQR